MYLSEWKLPQAHCETAKKNITSIEVYGVEVVVVACTNNYMLKTLENTVIIITSSSRAMALHTYVHTTNAKPLQQQKQHNRRQLAANKET